MPFTDAALAQAITALTDAELTVHLHTGDPGANGTANRVPTASIGSATIAASGAFTITNNGRTATLDADLSFGTAAAAVTGVSWISIFDGTSFFARRELAAPMDVADGAAVVITAATFVLNATSTDT